MNGTVRPSLHAWYGCMLLLSVTRREGPEGQQEGVNGSQLKFLQFEMIGLMPRFTPNPRVPGDVWSSYEGATPTQESPRNKLERTRMQTQTTAQKQARYTHRLNRRTKRHVVGSTDAQGR